MPVFSRRSIQKALNEVNALMPSRQFKHLIELLNVEGSKANEKRYAETISATWEIMIIAAFLKSQTLEYEAKISNGKNPDFRLIGEIPLMGDISTVSDDQQHIKNPVDQFRRLLAMLWKESHCQLGGISWRVESVDLKNESYQDRSRDMQWMCCCDTPNIRRGPIVRLALPLHDTLEAWMRPKLGPFFEGIASNPSQQSSIRINEQYSDEISVDCYIEFDPKKKNFTLGLSILSRRR